MHDPLNSMLPGAHATQTQGPIGIFDSGVGGLTVAAAIRELLPNETLFYLGDTARVPYGTKSASVVQRYTLNSTRFLADHGAKLLVVACNTATAAGLGPVRDALARPLIGVIEPGAAMAVLSTRNGRVGVIGTEGTVQSGSYQRAIHERNADIQVFSKACPLFVPLVEEGLLHHAATRLLAEEYLEPLLKSQIDTLVLGCTHYPLLQPLLQSIAGPAVTIIDSAHTVAHEVATLLKVLKIAATSKDATDRFFATDVNQRLHRVGSAFLGTDMNEVELIDL